MTTYLTERITVDPDICHGKPTIRGTRLMVYIILGYSAAGDTPEDILEDYSWLEREDITACLEFATMVTERPYALPAAA